LQLKYYYEIFVVKVAIRAAERVAAKATIKIAASVVAGILV